jgi:hypothetical protein
MRLYDKRSEWLFGILSHLMLLAFIGTLIVYAWEEFHKNHRTVFHDWFPLGFRILWFLGLFVVSFLGLLWTIRHSQASPNVSAAQRSQMLMAIVLSLGPGMIVYFYAVIVRGWLKPAPSLQNQST